MTDGRTDGGVYNIPKAFPKEIVGIITTFQCFKTIVWPRWDARFADRYLHFATFHPFRVVNRSYAYQRLHLIMKIVALYSKAPEYLFLVVSGKNKNTCELHTAK